MSRTQDSAKDSKARLAIVGALQRLVLERRFEQVSVGTIVAAADVGRSTFYEHFRCKEDLLRVSLSPVITVLAETIHIDRVTDRLLGMLEHLLSQANMTRAYLRGSLSPLVIDCLAVEIDRNLADRSQPTYGGIPRRMLAAQIAETIFGLIRCWVSHHQTVSSSDIAFQLIRTAKSALECHSEDSA